MTENPTYEELVQRVRELEQVEKTHQVSENRLKAMTEASFEAIFFSDNGVCLDEKSNC